MARAPIGGATPGAGRPKGSKQIFSRDSVKKLTELGFDPIEKMVELMSDLDELIERELAKAKPSSMTVAKYKDTQKSIVAELMRYGYSRTPEKLLDEGATKEPFRLILTRETKNVS